MVSFEVGLKVTIELTPKGNSLVDAWLEGNEANFKAALASWEIKYHEKFLSPFQKPCIDCHQTSTTQGQKDQKHKLEDDTYLCRYLHT